MKFNPRTLLLASGLLLSPQVHAATNLILNGSFEQPGGSGPYTLYTDGSLGIPNWSVFDGRGGDIAIHHSSLIGSVSGSTFNSAQAGDYYLDLSGGGTQHAGIFQLFSTIPSQSYELSFYIGASGSTPPAATINVQLIGTTQLLATTLTPPPPGTNIKWALQTFSFVADSTTSSVLFQDYSSTNDDASFVDNVRVESIPEPSSTLLCGFGSLFLLRRRRF